MPISLIETCRDGKSLPAAAAEAIHYPSTGAATLAEAEKTHFWFTVRRHVLLRMLRSSLQGLPQGSSPRGLDLGCGTGFNAVFLSELGFPTIGLDAHDSFREMESTGRGLGFLSGDVRGLDLSPEFDFVLLLDVLEHLPDDLEFLEQALRCLKPGGVAVVTVPAFQWLWSPADESAGHLRRYTKQSMAAMVSKLGSGARVEKQFYFYGATLFPFMISRWLQRVRKSGIKQEFSPPGMLNSLLEVILRMESLLIRAGGLPLGSSLFLTIRKPGS